MEGEPESRQCTARAFVRRGELEHGLGEEESREKVTDPETGKWRTRPCKNNAIRGGSVCHAHGGSTPQVRKAARQRLLYARDAALARIIQELDNPDADIAMKAATLAMKHAPMPDEEDGMGALADAVDEVRRAAERVAGRNIDEAAPADGA